MSKSAKQFTPIAIIGQSCVFPEALTPEDLWQLSLDKRDCLSPIKKPGFEQILLENIQMPPTLPLEQWRLRGGYVTNFDTVFNPEGFALPAETFVGLDKVFQYPLHCGREALKSAGYDIADMKQIRAGAIFGSLPTPTTTLAQYGQLQMLLQQGPSYFSAKSLQQLEQQLPDARNCFMSGFPAHLLRQALQLSGTAYTLDAACASALYAIRQACDLLQDHKADMMLSGAMNGVDLNFLYPGFTSLQALSMTGQSRPFHNQANGLVPGNGVGFIVLKRLEDALSNNDNILAVIRGIGLSNDGRSGGILVPAHSGQIHAMQQAYATSALKPKDIDVLECHATGTVTGDKTELESIQQTFPAEHELVIAGLKSNIGHCLAASGIAAVIRVTQAMSAGLKPPTLYTEDPIDILAHSSMRILDKAESWEARNGMRRAAVNCFGFGGNNAHLILEQAAPSANYKFTPPTSQTKAKPPEDIAIVGIQVITAGCNNTEEFKNAINNKTQKLAGMINAVELPTNLHFPPSDLREAAGMQLLILRATYDIMSKIGPLPSATTSAFIGLRCNADLAKHGLRWQLPEFLSELQTASEQDFPTDKAWLTAAREAIIGKFAAATLLGNLPNVTANRLNVQFDLKGPSFSISSEELSGIDALKIAITRLQKHDIDAAIVGGVDLCCDLIRTKAAEAVFKKQQQVPGDAAVVLVLKRLSDAQHNNDNIAAIIPAQSSESCELKLGTAHGHTDLSSIFGHTHCASGLLHVAAAALTAQAQNNCVQVGISALGERSDFVTVKPQEQNNDA